MAALEVTITGVLYDKTARTTRPVVLIGEASLTGVGVGGGPIMPGGDPPVIWGPNDPRPTPPIHIPPMPTEPPTNPSEPKPPPDGGGWGWHPTYGWGYFPMGSGMQPHA